MIRIPVTKTVIERIHSPSDLLQDCQEVKLDQLETNGDIERALGEAIVSIENCTEDKRRIKIWQEEAE